MNLMYNLSFSVFFPAGFGSLILCDVELIYLTLPILVWIYGKLLVCFHEFCYIDLESHSLCQDFGLRYGFSFFWSK